LGPIDRDSPYLRTLVPTPSTIYTPSTGRTICGSKDKTLKCGDFKCILVFWGRWYCAWCSEANIWEAVHNNGSRLFCDAGRVYTMSTKLLKTTCTWNSNYQINLITHSRTRMKSVWGNWLVWRKQHLNWIVQWISINLYIGSHNI
jgi:hypothetical protein